ncbi:unnamed protein product [Effrenium voratum]|uniref:Uncharacterized protein n=1 Tax=Effrenium voratum TaxID=2562239 RepID=A0AA36IG44_9DINO|nr:unnamed protein product [Effrenium voratum]
MLASWSRISGFSSTSRMLSRTVATSKTSSTRICRERGDICCEQTPLAAQLASKTFCTGCTQGIRPLSTHSRLKVFTTLRIAKFLLMSSDFEEQLLQLAASWWKAHRDPTFIYQLVEQARHLSAVEMLKTLERFHAESPVPAETRLKLFLQWVDVPSTELGDDVMFLRENLKSMSCLVECTEEKICELHTTFPKPFDLLIPASELLARLSGAKHLRCSLCHQRFDYQEQLDAKPCEEVVYDHAKATFRWRLFKVQTAAP